MKTTNRSCRVDETYIKVKGQVKYLYRAVDSTGQSIDFLLTAKPIPPVINVDKNQADPAAISELKREAVLPRRVRLPQCKFLNNVVEQDHRVAKKRTWLAKGYGAFHSAWRTLEGIETMHMIRKGRVRWVVQANVIAQAQFISKLFGLAA